jgi:hypothetical protein
VKKKTSASKKVVIQGLDKAASSLQEKVFAAGIGVFLV